MVVFALVFFQLRSLLIEEVKLSVPMVLGILFLEDHLIEYEFAHHVHLRI